MGFLIMAGSFATQRFFMHNKFFLAIKGILNQEVSEEAKGRVLGMLQNSIEKSSIDIKSLQSSLLYDLLLHHNKHNQYIRSLAYGRKLYEIVNDFESFPITTRHDFKINIGLTTTDLPKCHGNLFNVQTSGSTGEPVCLRKTGWNRAA